MCSEGIKRKRAPINIGRIFLFYSNYDMRVELRREEEKHRWPLFSTLRQVDSDSYFSQREAESS